MAALALASVGAICRGTCGFRGRDHTGDEAVEGGNLASAYFEANGLVAAHALLKTRVTAEVKCYEVRGCLRLALFPVHERAAGLKAGTISLLPESPGFVASYAKDKYAPQPALLESHRDHLRFGKGYKVRCVGDLNSLQQVGRTRKDFVLACEFRQESKLADIAAKVKAREAAGKSVKVICIAGPTSSGKTTFANKLCMYLKNLGFVAEPLTVDHYYLPMDRQPKYQARQQRGDVDYDHIESMDVTLVGEHLNALADGKSVMTPVYNMKTGFRDGDGHKVEALPENGILVIEGIHALNPLYTQAVAADKVFKIFISPLTALQLDDCNSVKTTHHRLLRRMSRDYLFRGNSAATTLKMWDNVRQGEGEWIFPHQNNADFVMNSAAEYEVPILKTFIEPLLRNVMPDDAQYFKAAELLKTLDYFGTWPPDLAPPAALLHEFIGGGDATWTFLTVWALQGVVRGLDHGSANFSLTADPRVQERDDRNERRCGEHWPAGPPGVAECPWDSGDLDLPLLQHVPNTEDALHLSRRVLLRGLFRRQRAGVENDVPTTVRLWALGRWRTCRDTELVSEALAFVSNCWRSLRAAKAASQQTAAEKDPECVQSWVSDEEALFKMFSDLEFWRLQLKQLLTPWVPPQLLACHVASRCKQMDDQQRTLIEDNRANLAEINRLRQTISQLHSKLEVIDSRSVQSMQKQGEVVETHRTLR
ncbi:unnamed protein product [Polarella glacialis]|uniref:Phosphoribulokinase/uridine kinase domain-containing protein n=2 Tax=Polarella glacialis TaxID=89957 RepID=A0A813HP16_POLGL|nr:unnamed protein product [Polarella glacialis]